MGLSAEEWLSELASELGVRAPSDHEMEELLHLASTAAHASERTAAPVSCCLVGLAGLSPADAAALAEVLAERLTKVT